MATDTFGSATSWPSGDLPCSEGSSHEPLPGSAAHQLRWVALEHPGPWGRDIFDGVAFSSEISERIRTKIDNAQARLLLIRRPGTGRQTPGHRVLLADTRPGRSTLRELTLDRVEDIVDTELFPEGVSSQLAMSNTPTVLVCTHGKRDKCCAVRGRPVAEALTQQCPEADVWECSHTGGHRFAPSVIVLPTGYTYGSQSAQEYVDIVRGFSAGTVPMQGLRGRSTWDSSGQVAEIAVRESIDATPDDLDVIYSSKTAATVVHLDGRTWRVQLEAVNIAPRPASCGATAKPAVSRRAVALERIDPAEVETRGAKSEGLSQ